MTYTIRRHRGGHYLNTQTLVGVPVATFALAHEAVNYLQRIADVFTARGGTVSGAGFALYATEQTGEQFTYRIRKH